MVLDVILVVLEVVLVVLEVVLEVVLVVLEVALDPSGKVSWKGIRYSSYSSSCALCGTVWRPVATLKSLPHQVQK